MELGWQLRAGVDPHVDTVSRPVVTAVVQHTPAAYAEIVAGDVILKVNSKEVWVPADIAMWLRHCPAGAPVVVEVFRPTTREVLDCELVFAQAPSTAPLLASSGSTNTLQHAFGGKAGDVHLEMHDPMHSDLPRTQSQAAKQLGSRADLWRTGSTKDLPRTTSGLQKRTESGIIRTLSTVSNSVKQHGGNNPTMATDLSSAARAITYEVDRQLAGTAGPNAPELLKRESFRAPAHGRPPAAPAQTAAELDAEQQKKLEAVKKLVDIHAHRLTAAELESELRTNLSTGLAPAETEQRLLANGLNQLTPPPTTPWIFKFLIHFVGGFQSMMIVGAILCFIVYGLDESKDPQNLWLGIVLLVVVLLTGLFSYYQASKSEALMAGFKKLTNTTALVIRGGVESTVDAVNLVVGDVVVMSGGQKVPADIRVLECSNLKVDSSALTGESEPLNRVAHKTDENPMETKNLMFCGTFIYEGTGKGVVFATGDATVIGRIAASAIAGKKPQTQLQHEIHYFIRIMACIACTLGVVFFLVGLFAAKYHWLLALIFCIGIIVANVPEGLLPQLTVQLYLTANLMAKKNVMVKNLEIIETLGSITAIASDKTGTLTQNVMTLSHMFINKQIFNTGPDAVSGTQYATYSPTDPCYIALQTVSNLCTTTKFVPEPGKPITPDTPLEGNPSEKALARFFQRHSDVEGMRGEHVKAADIPFNSNNKWMATIRMLPENSQYVIYLKGAPERVLAMCSTLFAAGAPIPLTPELRDMVSNANEELGSRGERVLAFARLPLDPETFHTRYEFDTDAINFPMKGFSFIGLCSLIDPPRPGVPEAIRLCQGAFIQVMMVTGDHPVTAQAIARSIGILPDETIEERAKRERRSVASIDKMTVDAVVIHGGEQLPNFTDADWDYTLSRKQIVFARTLPQQKQEIVSQLQKRGHIVAVTGDGVNDSPALKKASCGIAMGIMGSDIAKDAADIVLMDDNFASIVAGIEEGRLVFDNMKKCITYVLSSNVPEIVPFLLFVAAKLPLALEIVMILAVDIGTDLMPAISLAWERGELAVMQQPPRSRSDRLVGRRLFFIGYFQLGVLETLAAFIVYFAAFHHFGFESSDLWGQAMGWTTRDSKADAADLERFAAMALRNPIFQRELLADPTLTFFDYRMHALRVAQSTFLFATVIAQIGNILCVKTRYSSLFTSGLKNKWIAISIVVEIILIAIVTYTPPFNAIFSTRPVPPKLWAMAIPVIPVMLAYEEARKFCVRRWPKGWVAWLTAY